MTEKPDPATTNEDDACDTIARQMDTSGVTGVMRALREDATLAAAEYEEDFGETTVILPSHFGP
jgi:hypothetical protein